MPARKNLSLSSHAAELIDMVNQSTNSRKIESSGDVKSRQESANGRRAPLAVGEPATATLSCLEDHVTLVKNQKKKQHSGMSGEYRMNSKKYGTPVEENKCRKNEATNDSMSSLVYCKRS